MNKEAVHTQPALSLGFFSNYLELTKPRLTLMALATVALGFLMGSTGPLKGFLCLNTLFGSLLVGGGANALNQYLERDIDAKMKRTEQRPIPSGRLHEKKALACGIILSLIGTAHLFIFVNTLTGLISLTTLLGYVLVYTPLKLRTPLNTFVGAFVGALPILMGWTASGSELCLESGVLFLILFLWQLPHFLAIAWVYREDYAKSGLQMFTVFDKSGVPTAWQIALYSLVLFAASLLPLAIGLSGFFYFLIAFPAGLGFLGFAFYLIVSKLAQAKRFVLSSIIYLLVIILGMALDKI